MNFILDNRRTFQMLHPLKLKAQPQIFPHIKSKLLQGKGGGGAAGFHTWSGAAGPERGGRRVRLVMTPQDMESTAGEGNTEISTDS